MAERAGGAVELEVAARLDDRPGNPAFTSDGRFILSLHPFPYGDPSPYRVVVHAIPPPGPGSGLQWDEDAVSKFSKQA